MSHNLKSPTHALTKDIAGKAFITHSFTCDCEGWSRTYAQHTFPGMQSVESDHAQHAHRAGAEELRTGAIPKIHQESPLEDILRAMAKVAQASVQAAEAMEGFVEAHKDAKTQGVGVVVVRQADGSTYSSPNVFVPAGSAIFMDEPKMDLPEPIKFMDHETIPAIDYILPIPQRTIIETGLAA